MKYTHDEKDKQVYQFTDILSRNGITISASSALERLCYDVLELNQRHKYPRLRNPNEDFRGYFMDVLGFSDFIAKICNVAQLPNFTVLLPHLKLMAEALNNSTIPQTTSSLSGDMISNQLFELYVGSVCLACACFSNVELEQPTGSTQPSTNPDILFDFEMERWAIACKVLHTRNPLTLINNIEKGVEQIERCKQARRGVVLVNIRNIIDFDEFLPILNEEAFRKDEEEPLWGAFLSDSTFLEKMTGYSNRILEGINGTIGRDVHRQIYENKKASPCFGIFASAASMKAEGGLPTPTILRYLSVITSDGFDCSALNSASTKTWRLFNNHLNPFIQLLV